LVFGTILNEKKAQKKNSRATTGIIDISLFILISYFFAVCRDNFAGSTPKNFKAFLSAFEKCDKLDPMDFIFTDR
jgi:hypothetical protein